ncbi:GNAT family N-acetyltransferase [Marinococcus sp. PL1-022]|uniref:GNAT family N-acetyltransferase n=1 Tax=Marinococcus sp. PL1-022 TaxID=3095363 RepID=UPI0029C4E223|nr:GNAT family N-acetyltransferase [Marinococcus sp. PL1-022]MDX6153280.1 GNAT family N-acetyltransferase [Marinococcus sp. PL1-022]
MSIRIRTVETEDIPSLAEAMQAYIVDHYEHPDPGIGKLKTLIKKLLAQPEIGIQFIVEHYGDLIGFATLYQTFSTLQVKKTAILNDLYIYQEFQGQHYGKELLEFVLSYVQSEDYAGMVLETDRSNKKARRLYESLGGVKSAWTHYEWEF